MDTPEQTRHDQPAFSPELTAFLAKHKIAGADQFFALLLTEVLSMEGFKPEMLEEMRLWQIEQKKKD